MPDASTSDSASELRFYEDIRTAGNVIAVGLVRDDGRVEGYRATYDRENSPVSRGAISTDALGDRLTEEGAREKHPRLFEKIDD
jgi:hypothetical protein